MGTRFLVILSLFHVMVYEVSIGVHIRRKHHHFEDNELKPIDHSKQNHHHNLERITNGEPKQHHHHHRHHNKGNKLNSMPKYYSNAYIEDYNEFDDYYLDNYYYDSYYYDEYQNGDLWNDYPDDNKEYSFKTQQTALLLTVFLGSFGAGRFYVGDYLRASIKWILWIIFVCGSPMAYYHYCKQVSIVDVMGSRRNISLCRDRACGAFENIMYVGWIGGSAVFLAWLIADIIMFAMNVVPDYDTGLELRPI